MTKHKLRDHFTNSAPEYLVALKLDDLCLHSIPFTTDCP